MKLTELQKDIITKIIEGKTNTQIAAMLSFSCKTIEKELGKTYKYFGINSGSTSTKRTILIREVMKLEFAKLSM